MSLPAPRPDLAVLERYHSPQLDVAVRLNTNESPYPPVPAFIDAWLAALRDVPLHRYPDREARGCAPCSPSGSVSPLPVRSAPTGRTRCSKPCCSPTRDQAGGR